MASVDSMSPRVRKPKKFAQVCFPAWAVPIGCTWAGLQEPIVLERMLHWDVGTFKTSTLVRVFLTDCATKDRL